MLSWSKWKYKSVKKGILNILISWIFSPGYPDKISHKPLSKLTILNQMPIWQKFIRLHQRVSSFPSFFPEHRRRRIGRGIRASITVEASVVLPLFMIFCVQMISFIGVFRIHSMLEVALHQEVGRLSLYAYAYEKIGGGEGEQFQSYLEDAYILEQVKKRVGRENLNNSMVEGGSQGIRASMISSGQKSEQDVVDVTLTYTIIPPIRLLGFEHFTLSNRCRMKKWTGYRIEPDGSGLQQEIVYITEYGRVFHKSEDCSHIRLSIRYVEKDSVSGLRNTDGGKYYPCEFCGKGSGASVIITQDGNRYHYNGSCSGLKRWIHAVKISEVGGRGPCSRCYN